MSTHNEHDKTEQQPVSTHKLGPGTTRVDATGPTKDKRGWIDCTVTHPEILEGRRKQLKASEELLKKEIGSRPGEREIYYELPDDEIVRTKRKDH